MIYIYTEDSKDGLELCKSMKQQYFDEVQIHSLNGIWNLKDKIEHIVNSMEDNKSFDFRFSYIFNSFTYCHRTPAFLFEDSG